MRELLESYYLDYFNNYLTVKSFAVDNQLTLGQASKVIELGRSINQDYANRVEK